MPKASKKIGVGIIGSGGIAQGAHMPGYAAISGECEIVAVADVDKSAAKKAADQFKVPNLFTDYKKMLEMDEIQAVSVCTPNFLHMQPTVDALKAGKHVLCEKPMAMNASEARKMVDAAKKAGKILQIGYNSRFAPSNQLLKRYIEAGGH